MPIGRKKRKPSSDADGVLIEKESHARPHPALQNKTILRILFQFTLKWFCHRCVCKTWADRSLYTQLNFFHNECATANIDTGIAVFYPCMKQVYGNLTVPAYVQRGMWSQFLTDVQFRMDGFASYVQSHKSIDLRGMKCCKKLGIQYMPPLEVHFPPNVVTLALHGNLSAVLAQPCLFPFLEVCCITHISLDIVDTVNWVVHPLKELRITPNIRCVSFFKQQVLTECEMELDCFDYGISYPLTDVSLFEPFASIMTKLTFHLFINSEPPWVSRIFPCLKNLHIHGDTDGAFGRLGKLGKDKWKLLIESLVHVRQLCTLSLTHCPPIHANWLESLLSLQQLNLSRTELEFDTLVSPRRPSLTIRSARVL